MNIKILIFITTKSFNLEEIEAILGKGDYCWSIGDEKKILNQPTLKRKSTFWSIVEIVDKESDVIDKLEYLLIRVGSIRKDLINLFQKHNLTPILKVERISRFNDNSKFSFYLDEKQVQLMNDIRATIDIDW